MENEALIGSLLQTWGTGGFDPSHPDCEANTKKFVAEDTVIDLTVKGYQSKHHNNFKVYHGHEGFKEMLAFLGLFEFLNFNVSFLAGQGDQVVSIPTGTLKGKATGKVAEETFTDVTVWKIRDGKVCGAKFFFGDAPGFDSVLA
uniref:SnoaL-like domain-containing protein n=1 Tax=Palpitomonas bilix TaxID=652834 RepID=A0A7S3G5F2_9EUKA|mmetsp:Transcript_3068/g.5931  ORF Transcript_3068/g.5931 Transcript_3068/m.5931 type:complete len:144 (+) Transcript_3068:112-543(+)|eukprot:CAMPEP_0113892192 /NCGR_PEP_ID=MMETSP0780_2-20120614/15258_1 /TAXON_ID=652834 /ORGANISM="Palpitomonas bilix" /LENGTH=143 /DNA_ID=CAMNT_0000882059 /DNA_START=45 /DNA_END=476 /DNA_ORIENTATION=+ /assembly_acc=CAM_ASM_000599